MCSTERAYLYCHVIGLIFCFVFLFFVFFVFCLFVVVVVVVVVVAISWAAPVAYGGSQARGRIGAVAAGLLQPQQHRILATSSTYTTAHNNARSLTH